MKSKILLIFVFFLFAFNSFCQNLEPNKSIFELYNYQFEYYSKIRTTLLEGLNDTPKIRFLVTPSFKEEYVFQIDDDKNSKNLFATLNLAKKSIWSSKKKTRLKSLKYKAIISNDDSNLLHLVFSAFIDKIHYEIKTIKMAGTDGTNYYLGVWDNGLKSGKIWSPKNPNLNILIDVVDDLIRQLKIGKSNISISQKNRIELNKVLINENVNPDISEYKLLLKINKIIANSRNRYNEKLNPKDIPKLGSYLNKLSAKLLQQISYDNLTLNSCIKIIKEFEQDFIITFFETEEFSLKKDEVLQYTKLIRRDNIFLHVLNEIRN